MTRRVINAACWIALTAYVSVLLTLTHLPKPPGIFEGQNDKTLHFMAYFTLGVLASTASYAQFRSRSAIVWCVLVAGAIFAALDEATQPIFGRHADLLDYRADLIGLTCGIGVVAAIRWICLRRRKPI